MTQREQLETGLLIRDASGISADWLGHLLGEPTVTLHEVQRIGTGQMSLTYRVTYATARDPAASVVVKLAAEDEASRATGVNFGIYRREILFYQRLSAGLTGPPRCLFAEYDDGWFTLVLNDAPGAVQGDQVAGCDAATARRVIDTLAALHAPTINDTATAAMDFLTESVPINGAILAAVLPMMLQRYDDRINGEHAEVCRRYVRCADALAADPPAPYGLVHGDFRLDNLLFTSDDRCTVIDWQTVRWGPAMGDLAYFLGTSLDVDTRRRCEHELVGLYYRRLLEAGVTDATWQQCWEGYRREAFGAVAMAIIASMSVERTDRGDDMFTALLTRACQQVIDLDSFDLVPNAGETPAAVLPSLDDESPHQSGREQFWNESWYFDAVSVDPAGDTTGVYIRLGHVPNLSGSIYSLAVVRPGHQPVMVTDYCCPHPALRPIEQTVDTRRYRAAQRCVEPLCEYHLQFGGSAQQFSDDADPLHQKPGTDVALRLDLRWITDGRPYQWRISTRYEMPCHVSGTITINDERIVIDGPGQRDHSWGPRDWWTTSWMWTAFHLDDGTRVHAVTSSELPGAAVGYIQQDGHIVEELAAGTATATFTDDGLVTDAHLTLGSQPLNVEVRPMGFGPLRMQSPDGRVSFFPRAAATFCTTDGRIGRGWIEWNTGHTQTPSGA
jgi:Phosphotransferase enzyme family